MKKIQPKLTGVPETMLISIRSRYLETKEKNGIINDPKTVEILDQIECDFSGKKEVSKWSQKGTAIRTEILDELTQKFLDTHKECVVVNFACWLDTRFYRIGNKKVEWFDLDLPESIALRRNFFEETENFHFIEKSVLDFSWIEKIPKNNPILFIAEWLFMYFTEQQVKSIFETIINNFENAEIIFEAIAPFMVRNYSKHPDLKWRDVSFKWGIKSWKEIENWWISAKFIQDYFYFERHFNKLPFLYKVLSFFPFFRKGMKIIHLKFEK